MNEPGLHLDENVSGRLGDTLRAFGHDVWVTDRVDRKGASDIDQLSFAAEHRRLLKTHDTHDAGHFELLHEARHRWSRDWEVIDAVRHAGILLLPDPGFLAIADAARAVDALLRSGTRFGNRLLALTPRLDWREITI